MATIPHWDERAVLTSDLEMVERHVLEGRRHVHRQNEILARLEELGADSNMAAQLLIQFEVTLAEHEAHRDRIRIALGLN